MDSRPVTLSSRKVIHQHQTPDSIMSKVLPKLPVSTPPIDTTPIFSSCDRNDGSVGYRYTLLPLYKYHGGESPSPTSTQSDASDMSQPPSPCYQPEWIYRRLKSPEDSVTVDEPAWPTVIRPRAKADRSIPSLNSTDSQFAHTRPRGPSVSSIPSVATASSSSSVSKPQSPQSKSILTRTSSASTKNSLVKSVKFVDMPTIHYGYEDFYEDGYDDCEIDTSRPPTPPLSHKGGALRGFRRYIWPLKQNTPGPAPAPALPAISGPLALGTMQVDHSDNTSLRPIRSNDDSYRFERSHPTTHGSFSLRTTRSTESFRSARLNGTSKFKAFLGKMVP